MSAPAKGDTWRNGKSTIIVLDVSDDRVTYETRGPQTARATATDTLSHWQTWGPIAWSGWTKETT